MNAYIVMHNHSLGSDAWVKASRMVAEGSVYMSILKDIDRNDTYKKDDIKKILKFIKDNEFKAAKNLWFEMSEQSFEVRPVEIDMQAEARLSLNLKREMEHTMKYLNHRLFDG